MFYKNIFARATRGGEARPGVHKILKAIKLPPSEMWSLSLASFANVKWVLFIGILDSINFVWDIERIKKVRF